MRSDECFLDRSRGGSRFFYCPGTRKGFFGAFGFNEFTELCTISETEWSDSLIWKNDPATVMDGSVTLITYYSSMALAISYILV